MPSSFFPYPCKKQRRTAWWLCAASLVLIGMITAFTFWSERSLALLADPARVQHQVDTVRLALANVRGVIAPDSSCRPARCSILLDVGKRAAMPCIRAALEKRMVTWS